MNLLEKDVVDAEAALGLANVAVQEAEKRFAGDQSQWQLVKDARERRERCALAARIADERAQAARADAEARRLAQLRADHAKASAHASGSAVAAGHAADIAAIVKAERDIVAAVERIVAAHGAIDAPGSPAACDAANKLASKLGLPRIHAPVPLEDVLALAQIAVEKDREGRGARAAWAAGPWVTPLPRPWRQYQRSDPTWTRVAPWLGPDDPEAGADLRAVPSNAERPMPRVVTS